ncbi:DUF4828 domain-containing protein [Vagococcus sp. BWB3-3]|uniref:DUF4828 domain-containing protein n=1 Tax=Vagococcus allomyrinae TaxID=2794353 RepID=A0A940PF55_9ENTE|nr:DUF4828 domain-containing protein [Vagococcus allomyrinae]MBP1043705.1 DUF4828 domain-containing protein [Vagococcus allomyrinae]
MAKKHWSVFLGLSLVAGVASSLLLKRNKDSQATLPQHYQGTWWFIDQQQKVQHSLEVLPDFSLKIDGRPLPAELLELTAERLVLQDQYGYHLVINCRLQEPVDFYDEANDSTYLLEKKP